MNIKEKKKKKVPLGKKESLSPELTDVQMLGEQSNFIRTYVPVITIREKMEREQQKEKNETDKI